MYSTVSLSDRVWKILREKKIYSGEDRPYLVRIQNNIFVGVGPSKGWQGAKKLEKIIKNLQFLKKYEAEEIRYLFYSDDNIYSIGYSNLTKCDMIVPTAESI
jgi:hypothetical protein